MYDVIVVGGGSMGISAAYYQAKEGSNVLVLDKYEIPNDMGSHHGMTRMLRLNYGNGSSYVPLAQEALNMWLDLERETGSNLFKNTGAITVGHPGSTFVDVAIESAQVNNIPYKVMNADEIMSKWNGLNLPNNFIGCFDPSAGFLFSETCLTVYKEEAIKLGADIHENEGVTSVKAVDDYVEVQTDKGVYHAKKAIVTTGAWLQKLLPDIDLNIQPVRKTISWFKPLEESVYDGNFPCYIFDTEDHGHYYGFPDFDGHGLKLGRMDDGVNCDADELNRTYGAYEQDENEVRGFLESYLPKAPGELIEGKVCVFANTPDTDFIIDVHPNHPNIIMAGGFSGHGFKFASVIGSILSELSTDGTTSRDISFLSLSRFSDTAHSLKN